MTATSILAVQFVCSTLEGSLYMHVFTRPSLGTSAIFLSLIILYLEDQNSEEIYFLQNEQTSNAAVFCFVFIITFSIQDKDLILIIILLICVTAAAMTSLVTGGRGMRPADSGSGLRHGSAAPSFPRLSANI